MRTVSLRLADVSRTSIPIGYEGEQNHTRVIFYCAQIFDDYPDAVATMVIKPATGDAYPQTVTKSGRTIIWDVTPSNVYGAGSGTYQFTFIQGEEIIKSIIGSFSVNASIIGNGEAPDPVTDWVNEANEVLANIPNTINEAVDDALEEAKESGDFKGDPGEPGAKGDKGDPGEPAPASAVAEAVDDYLEENFSNPSNPPLDRTLTSGLSAAPADIVGNLKNEIDAFEGGTTGQVLRKKSGTDFDVEWASVAQPTDAQVESAVEGWLDDHPEATTTVDFAVATKVFPTVAAMVADMTLKNGDNVATRNYYAAGDNGGANYVVSSSHTGIFYIELNNGLYANRLSENGVLPAESIGIKAYAASTENPDEDDMDRNVSLFNTAVYNGIRLLFGKGYFYFDEAIQLANKTNYVIRGIDRNLTNLVFPSSDGLYFCDPIYYNYYVITGMSIKSYGHCIVCDESCLTVLDSHFEWLWLTSETGDCFHGPNYNTAKYVPQGGGATVYDTCVQNCVFDFVNASAPQGAAFANIMGMYTYYQHMNLISCKYGFRNCDGIIDQLNTLGEAEDYFIYYDKANSNDLRWRLMNVNAEGIAKAFIYTEAYAEPASGEDTRKPDTANIAMIGRFTAINSGWTLNGNTTNNEVYPITIHTFKNMVLINSNGIVAPSKYPTAYNTEVVLAYVLALRSAGFTRYTGGPTFTVRDSLANTILTIYGDCDSTKDITRANVAYSTFINRRVPSNEEIWSDRIFGGKAMDVWEVKASDVSGSALNPPIEHIFCDAIAVNVDSSTQKAISFICSEKESVYPGRIITVVNRKDSQANLVIRSFNSAGFGDFVLHKDYRENIVLTPGKSIKFSGVYDTQPNGTINFVWKPIDYESTKLTSLNVDSLFKMIEDITGITMASWTYGYYINTSGETINVSNPQTLTTKVIKYAVMNCSEGDKFTLINGIGGGNDRLWAFADSSGNRLSVSADAATASKLVLTAPQDAAKLIVNTRQESVLYKNA